MRRYTDELESRNAQGQEVNTVEHALIEVHKYERSVAGTERTELDYWSQILESEKTAS